jgi:hypothetical protein
MGQTGREGREHSPLKDWARPFSMSRLRGILLEWASKFGKSALRLTCLIAPRPQLCSLILELPRWEASQMLQDELIPGPIEGLHLPRRAWKVLQRENITTLDQLRTVADRIGRFENIGLKTARIIQAELARIWVRERPHPYRGHWTRP